MLITEQETINSYYQALLNRESSFVGIFYVGVKTTDVFCIATCRARKPKLKNVEFYTTVKDALDNGYRPCKICKPTENANQAPAQVEKAIELVKDNLKEKITDDQLRENQISPDLVRRWFKENYGMTFHAYQRMFRINNAVQELKKGKKTIDTALDSGYESLSGFGYTYKKLIGQSPQNSDGKTIILIDRFTTPLGPIFICATDIGVCLLEFTDRAILEKEFRDLQRLLTGQIMAGENKHIKQAKVEISEYFAGNRQVFEVPVHMPGTPFQVSVWKELLKLAYGETASYSQQAQKIGKLKAVRAVGTANGANRISIIVPCHRVLGSNGSLTGFGGGLERKRWLLEHEKSHRSIGV
ncbi:MAG: bifunctional transcriptional activator/DNA repair enzyme AdaA [Anaerolineae bacterium]